LKNRKIEIYLRPHTIASWLSVLIKIELFHGGKIKKQEKISCPLFEN
jgi:hypothetical protein